MFVELLPQLLIQQYSNTKYRLADIGTKALSGPTQHFLLKNTKPFPISTSGECQRVRSIPLTQISDVLSYLEYDVLCEL